MIQRIPTRRPILRRAGAVIWQALNDYPWLPLAAVLVALYFINS